jgi:choline dehydrogenase-like flavoprotein
MVHSKEYEFLIVGSGAGGATLARELAKRGREVIVLERGNHEARIGTFQDSLRYFDGNKLTKTPRKSKEGTILWRAFMAGGTTVVADGNQLPCLQQELARHGIDIEAELDEASDEMGVAPIDETLLGERSLRVREAASKLGYHMARMPKAIDAEKCRRCQKCPMGCPFDAKWTALTHLQEAAERGSELVCGTRATEILLRNGKAIGIGATGLNGPNEFRAQTVILSAGGLGTPVLLQRAGIAEAGQQLFVDLYVNTVGAMDDTVGSAEPLMALVDDEFHESEGFILSTYVPVHRLISFIEFGPKGLSLSPKRLIGLMTKTADELEGRVYPDGVVSKPATEHDWARLNKGAQLAEEILVKAGVDPRSVVTSKPQGAHPGGTAAVGTVVDSHLQTEIDNLFVCDASVLPQAPGLPPILTIVALAKRLAKTLAS